MNLITVTSWWAPCLKSPASPLFTQPFFFSGTDQRKHQSSWSLAAQMASNTGNVSIWWRHHVLHGWHPPKRQIKDRLGGNGCWQRYVQKYLKMIVFEYMATSKRSVQRYLEMYRFITTVNRNRNKIRNTHWHVVLLSHVPRSATYNKLINRRCLVKILSHFLV